MSLKLRNNSHYSLRAFARDISLSPGQLSSVLNGKRGISPKKAREVFAAINIDSEEFELAILQVEKEHSRSEKTKQRAMSDLNNRLEDDGALQLTQDAFKVISDWSHFAVLQMITLKSYRSKRTSEQRMAWIAEKLGIQSVQVKLVLERLSRLDLVSRDEKGLFTVCHHTVLSPSGVPSSALRDFHKQVIQKALLAIDAQAVKERYLSSSMLPILESSVPKISKEISDFHQKILKKYGRVLQTDGEVVYALSQQFFKLGGEK